ncbi:flagellar basal body P-ring protein FlgI [bacterium]|nr:flagellar basal body P-ring protein FlgI [bacterium]
MKITLLFLILLSCSCWGARLKDIASLKGARANQLFGYGIVVGLAGTGDKSNELTESSLGLVLKGLGVDVKSQKMETKNAAAVVVTATLPPYSKSGTRLDVQVSSVGSASSLESGTLMMSSLRGADGKVYAMATGKVLALKKSAGGGGGQAGGSGGQNLVTGLIPGGAILERELPQNLAAMKEFRYQLLNPDFTTAVRVARRINEELGGKYATAVDAATIDVLPPYHYESNPVELLAQVEVIEVEADTRSKVVINPKTGTVVLGDQVRISPVAIAQGNLKIEIRDERAPAAEGAGAGSGETESGNKKEQKLMVMRRGASIADIASSLNEMGASSEDLISLLQALKASGALVAEIEMQ